MEIGVSKLGERGQIVVPQDFREELGIKRGDKFLVVKSDNKLVFQRMKDLKAKTIEQLRDDLIDIKIAEDRLREIEKGECVIQTKEKFLKEMEDWVKE